jgi:hypothetical protein
MTTFRVAAVQATYVLMDRDATIDRVADLTAKAAADGAQLVVFPEVFVPGTLGVPPTSVVNTGPALHQLNAKPHPGTLTERFRPIRATHSPDPRSAWTPAAAGRPRFWLDRSVTIRTYGYAPTGPRWMVSATSMRITTRPERSPSQCRR